MASPLAQASAANATSGDHLGISSGLKNCGRRHHCCQKDRKFLLVEHNLRLPVEGSAMRAQRRLPVTRTLDRSSKLLISTWRTLKRRLPGLMLVPGGVNLKCRSAPTYDRSCCQTGKGKTETRRKRTSLDMIQSAKPRAQLGSHLKDPMQQPNQPLKIANLAFGCKQHGLDGMQKFANLSLGKIKNRQHEKFMRQPMYSISTPI